MASETVGVEIEAEAEKYSFEEIFEYLDQASADKNY